MRNRSCFMCEHSESRYFPATDGSMEVRCNLTGKSHSSFAPSCNNQFQMISFGQIRKEKK